MRRCTLPDLLQLPLPAVIDRQIHSVTDQDPVEFRARVRQALRPVPIAAPVDRVWAALGRAEVLRSLYDRPGADAYPDAERMRLLIGELDDRGNAGVTLACCVQIASALPLLLSALTGGNRAVADLTLSGQQLLAFAATDSAAAGSDLTGLATTADLTGHRVVINGHKTWVTNATTCTDVLVLARHRPGRHFTAFTWVLVPVDAIGVTVTRRHCAPFTSAGIGDIDFAGVEVDLDRVVGRAGRGLVMFAHHIARERLAGAQWAVHLTRRALRSTRVLLEHRHAQGQPLWELAAVRQRYAEALVRQQMLAALVGSLEGRLVGGYDPAAAAMVKVAAAETAEYVLSACVKLQASQAYQPGGALSMLTEATVFGIGGGTTDLMLASIADHASELLVDGSR